MTTDHADRLPVTAVECFGPVEQDGQTPSPVLVAAHLKLGTLPLERVPWWAAQWLVDGYDGPKLRELAGFGKRDPILDLLSDALAETGESIPTSDVDAATIVFDEFARSYLVGSVGERWVVQQVEAVVADSGYSSAVIDQPLGDLYGLYDTDEAGPEPALCVQVRAASEAQLRRDSMPRRTPVRADAPEEGEARLSQKPAPYETSSAGSAGGYWSQVRARLTPQLLFAAGALFTCWWWLR